jgi:hypothetical protein
MRARITDQPRHFDEIRTVSMYPAASLVRPVAQYTDGITRFIDARVESRIPHLRDEVIHRPGFLKWGYILQQTCSNSMRA